MSIRMIGAVAVLALLAACAGPDGQSGRAPPPPADVSTAPAPVPQGPVAAPGVSAPAAPARAQAPAGESGDNLVVPGQAERQVPPPAGDPRTASERMADIRNWDRCVMQAQSAAEGDPLRPQLDVPEALCSRQLGMSSRLAVPNARRQ